VRQGSRPFDDLRLALEGDRSGVAELAGGRGGEADVRLDLSRSARTGIPEIVHGEHKSAETVAEALIRLAARNGRSLATRCSAEKSAEVERLVGPGWTVERHARARAVVVAGPGSIVNLLGGRIGILAAGTSDLPVAAEAALVAREMGANVDEAYDVGVAGLHRLVEPLERMVEAGIDVVVVAAGMDGALPSVVAGLVAVPVIGLPTSVGYGFGGGGVGALTTMLQSCAPGLVVVNIDNGVGAGSTAALIANRAVVRRRSG
jgi:hypothetical protein